MGPPDQAAPTSITDKLQAINPIARAAKILVPPTPTPATSPAVPAKPLAAPPSSTVDWVDPSTGKRMSGTTAERDAALKKPAAAKSPAAPRSMSKR